MIVKTKYCTNCRTTKPVDQFNKQRSRKDGLQGWCRTCAVAAARKWNRANAGRKTQNNARYRDSGKAAEASARFSVPKPYDGSRPWTDHEIDVATVTNKEGRYLGTAREVALALGRSTTSVAYIRRKNPREESTNDNN